MEENLTQLSNAIKEKLKNSFPELEGEEGSSDDGLDTYILQAIVQVVEYCNIEYDELNLPLILQICYIVEDRLTNDSLMGSTGAGDVKSVREGDVTVQTITVLDKVTALNKQGNMISDYYNILNKYRKLRA